MASRLAASHALLPDFVAPVSEIDLPFAWVWPHRLSLKQSKKAPATVRTMASKTSVSARARMAPAACGGAARPNHSKRAAQAPRACAPTNYSTGHPSNCFERGGATHRRHAKNRTSAGVRPRHKCGGEPWSWLRQPGEEPSNGEEESHNRVCATGLGAGRLGHGAHAPRPRVASRGRGLRQAEAREQNEDEIEGKHAHSQAPTATRSEDARGRGWREREREEDGGRGVRRLWRAGE